MCVCVHVERRDQTVRVRVCECVFACVCECVFACVAVRLCVHSCIDTWNVMPSCGSLLCQRALHTEVALSKET